MPRSRRRLSSYSVLRPSYPTMKPRRHLADARVARMAGRAMGGSVDRTELRDCGLSMTCDRRPGSERPPSPPSPSRLRGWSRESAPPGSLPGSGQGMWSGRSPQPLLRRGAVGTRPLGRPTPGGHRGWHGASRAPGHTSASHARAPHPRRGPARDDQCHRPASDAPRPRVNPPLQALAARDSPSASAWPSQCPPAGAGPEPRRPAARRRQSEADHRVGPSSHPKRARGRGARPDPPRWVGASGREQPTASRRAPSDPRLQVA